MENSELLTRQNHRRFLVYSALQSLPSSEGPRSPEVESFRRRRPTENNDNSRTIFRPSSVDTSPEPSHRLGNLLRLHHIGRQSIFLFRLSIAFLLCIPDMIGSIFNQIAMTFRTRVSDWIHIFFYGSNIPTFPNNLLDDSSDVIDPLSDIIRRFPSHAAWIIKIVMLFGAISRILLSILIGVYLSRNWSFCSVCPRPLRWWLAFKCVLQMLQVPLCFCLFRCITVLLHTTSSLAIRVQQHDSQLDAGDSTMASNSVRTPTAPPIENRLDVTDDTNIFRRHILSQPGQPTAMLPDHNRTSSRRLAGRRCRHELLYLSKRLIQLTNGTAWKCSVWLSIIAYAWFLVGVVWILGASSTATQCCCSGPDGRCPNLREIVDLHDPEYLLDSTIDSSIFFGYKTDVKPDIRLLVVIVLLLSMTRLVILVILFFLSRLLIKVPTRSFPSRERESSPANLALLHLREAFATFDRHPSFINHYWNHAPLQPLQHRRNSTDNTSTTENDSIADDEDIELRPYLFRTSAENAEDDTESVSSEDQNNNYSHHHNHDNIFTQRQRQFSTQRHRGLSISTINQLPIMFYSKLVFPRALKSKNSLARVLAKSSETSRRESHTTQQDGEGPTSSPATISTTKPQDSTYRQHDSQTTLSLCSVAKKVPHRQSRHTMQPSTPFFCSFLPRLVRTRDIEPLAASDVSDIGRRHLWGPRYINQLDCSHSSSTEREKSFSLLPSWRRLKMCFGSKRQIGVNEARLLSNGVTVGPTETPYDFTNELFIGHPLFLSSCSICLDDFEENCEIRQLPCRHGFHRQCIDTWLMQVDSCPLCHTPTFSSSDAISSFFRRRGSRPFVSH